MDNRTVDPSFIFNDVQHRIPGAPVVQSPNSGPYFQPQRQQSAPVGSLPTSFQMLSNNQSFPLATTSSAAGPLNVVHHQMIRRGPGRPKKETTSCSPILQPSQRRRRSRAAASTFRNSAAVGLGSGSCSTGTTGSDASSSCSASPGTPAASLGAPPAGSYALVASGESSFSGDTANFCTQDNNNSCLEPQPRCQLCNLIENTAFGLGPLLKFKCSPRTQYDLQSTSSNLPGQSSPTEEAKSLTMSVNQQMQDSSSELTLRINLKQSRIVRPNTKRTSTDESSIVTDLWEQVGFNDDFDSGNLDTINLHNYCLLWSLRGRHFEESFGTILTLIKQWRSQSCTFCAKKGASVNCKRCEGAEGHVYHVTCAQISGCFMDRPSFTVLCVEHSTQAKLHDFDVSCFKCGTDYEYLSPTLLTCLDCGRHCHYYCSGARNTLNDGQQQQQKATNQSSVAYQNFLSYCFKAGWQCDDCKSCRKCKSIGDQTKMLSCEICQKVYHLACGNPLLTSLPKAGWKCPCCRKCEDCGSRTPGAGQSSRWHANYTVCDSCYQQRNKGSACPLCGKAYRLMNQKFMRECGQCKKYVHEECDPSQSVASSTYICRYCRDVVRLPAALGQGQQTVLSSLMPSSAAALVPQQPSTSMATETDLYVGEQDDDDILNDILKSNALHSPMSDLDISCIDASSENFNIDTWTAAVEEELGGPDAFLNLASDALATSSQQLYPASASLNVPPPPTPQKSKRVSSKRGGAVRQRRSGRGRPANNTPWRQTSIVASAAATAMGLLTSHCATDSANDEDFVGPTAANFDRIVPVTDGDEYIHTVVVDNADEDFVFDRDMCVVCGSFGRNLEADMIACVQCGQCYHLYCAEVKLNPIIVKRGWRCFNCTICEECGRSDDEQRMLLCDECDYSVHTYCLQPPLTCIPSGSWTCHWCSKCALCESLLPTVTANSLTSTKNSGSFCPQAYADMLTLSFCMAPKICPVCESSYYCCPLCRIDYKQDEPLIRCEKCKKWSHSKCNGLLDENAIDRACDLGFKCILCRPGFVHSLEDNLLLEKPQSETLHAIDGVLLTKSGTTSLRTKIALPTIENMPYFANIAPGQALTSSIDPRQAQQAIDDVVDSVAALVSDKRCCTTENSGLEGESRKDFEFLDDENAARLKFSLKTAAQAPGAVKAKFKIGVGGFCPKPLRQQQLQQQKAFLAGLEQSSGRILSESARSGDIDSVYGLADDQMSVVPDTAAVTQNVNETGSSEVVKRRKRQKRKGPLDEMYPSYIQEAFFGSFDTRNPSSTAQESAAHQTILKKCALKEQDQRNQSCASASLPLSSQPPATTSLPHHHHHPTVQHTNVNLNDEASSSSSSHHFNPETASLFAPGDGVFGSSSHDDVTSSANFSNILNMLMDEDLNMDDVLGSGANSSGTTMIGHSKSVDSSTTNSVEYVQSPQTAVHQQPQQQPPHQTPNPPRVMIVDCPPPSYNNNQNHSQFSQQSMTPRPQQIQQFSTENRPIPQQQLQNFAPDFNCQLPRMAVPSMVQQQPPPQFMASPQPPTNFAGVNAPPAMMPQPPPYGQQSAPFASFGGGGAAESPPGDQSSGGGQTAMMLTSDAKSSLDRWESDEPLGDRATTAAVLYTNLNHPDLKMRFPLWPERAKQIGKLWRLLSPDQRQKFVLLARENRTASRQTVGKIKKNPNETTPNTMENESSSSIGCEMLFKVPSAPFAQQPQMPPQQQQQSHFSSSLHRQHSPILRHPFVEQQANFAAAVVPPQQQQQQTSNYQQRPSSAATGGATIKIEDYGGGGQAFLVHSGTDFRSQMPESDHRNMDNFPPLAPEFTLGKIRLNPSEMLSNKQSSSFSFNDKRRNLDYEDELLVEYRLVADEQKVLESRLAELRRHKKALVFKRKQLTLKMAAAAEQNSQSAPEALAIADKLNQSDCRLAELVDQIADVQRCLDPLKRRAKTNGSSMRDYRRRCGYVTPPPLLAATMPGDDLGSAMTSQSPAIAATPMTFGNNGDLSMQMSNDSSKRKCVKRRKKENFDETTEKDVAILLMEVVTKVAREVDGAAYDKNQEEFTRNSLLKCLLGRNSPVTKDTPGTSPVLKCGTSIAGLKRSTSAAERSPVRKRQRKSLTSSTTITLPSSNAATPISPFLGSIPVTKIEPQGPRNATQNVAVAHAEMASAYAAFLQQLAIKLQQSSATSKAAVLGEPAPRRDAFVIQQAVTQLADKVVQLFEKPSKVPSKRKSGTLKLSFTPDFYRHRYAPPKIRAPIKIEPPHVINPCGQTIPAVSAGNFSRITSLGMRCDSPDDLVVGPSNEFDEDLSAASYPALKPNLTHASACDNFSIQDGRLSPNFRITAHLPVRAQPADPPMVAFEQIIRSGFYHRHVHAQTRRKEDTVSVTLTLTRDASTDLRRVLVGLASLLGLDGPSSLDYELRLDTPPSSPALRIKEERDDKILCKMCHVSITEQGGVKKKWSELGLKPSFEEGEEALFCSSACFKRFSCEKLDAERKMMNLSDPSTSKALLPNCHSSLDEVISFVVEGGGAKIASAVAATASATQQAATAVASTSSLPSVQRFSRPYNGQTILEQAINARDLLTGARSIFGVVSDYSIAKSETDTLFVAQIKWKGSKWRIWTIADNAKLQAQEYDIQQLRLSLQLMLYRRYESADNLTRDKRKCEFCGGQGDDESERCGRLLNFDAARWVHVNCALWSAEVYETVDGGLVNVERAFRHSLGQSCAFCRRDERCGATLRCYKLRCGLHFHFACAYDNNCYFLRNKSVYCPDHPPDCADDILTNLAVLRRVYVERDENRLLAKLYQQNDAGRLAMRVGSLIFRHIGQLLPHQLKQFSTNKFIYPAGYDISRIFWSDKDLKSRKLYNCKVAEDKETNAPKFVIRAIESPGEIMEDQLKVEIEEDETIFQASSPTEAWNQILAPVESLRRKNAKSTLKLFPKFLFGEFLYGFVESSVRKMIESLPGVETLIGYEFKFGRNPLMDLPLAVNPSGCARCEPRFRTYLKRGRAANISSSQSHHQTMSLSAMLAMSGLGTLESQQALLWASLSGRPPSASTKWSQYRRMKQEWKSNIYLGRSKIQGLGLYAKKPIEMNTIVIEYIGEIIRNEVAERREKLYQENGRGVYMFRLDHERVVDATMSGGLARYINHSCDPNCTTESIELNSGESKIVIIACRPISEGEELCYDYQFDLEDDTSKIQCLCGAPNCQKWMN